MAMKTLSSAKVFKISTLRSYAKTRAMDAQLWNQVDLKPPPTSAQKMSLTSKGKNDVITFVATLRSQSEILLPCITTLDSELSLLKQFLYKNCTVFRNDKRIKMMKLLRKSVTRLIEMCLVLTVQLMAERHTPAGGSTFYVAPKGEYQHSLLRYQGGARLLAQILCYGQQTARCIIPAMRQGHFIAMANALQVLRILTRLYSATKQIHDAGILTGAGWVELPAGHQFPADLIDWLLADPSIRDVHQQLSLGCAGANAEPVTVWDAIRPEDSDTDAEMDDLLELRQLVSKTATAQENEEDEGKEKSEAGPRKRDAAVVDWNVDLGEPIPRDGEPPQKKKKKKKKNRNATTQGVTEK